MGEIGRSGKAVEDKCHMDLQVRYPESKHKDEAGLRRPRKRAAIKREVS